MKAGIGCSGASPGAGGAGRTGLILAGIVLIGLLVRLWGLSWGLPERTELHPDEHDYVIQHALKVSWQDPDPIFINYPSFLCYSTALVHGALKRLDPAWPKWKAYLVGRAISAGYGTLTILAVFFLARRLGGNTPGALLAAAWTALMPLHVWDSHVAATDVMMTFWITLTLLLSVQLHANPRPFMALLAGIGLGLATGSKYTAAVACLAPLTAVLLAQTTWLRRFALLFIVAVAALEACFAVTPFSFLRFPDLLTAMAYENAHTHGFHPGFSIPAVGFQYHRGLYQLIAAWPFSLGLPLYLATLAGTAWFVWKARRPQWIVLVFAAAFMALTCTMTFTPLRYYFPLLILGTLFAGMWFGAELAREPRTWRFRIMLALALAVSLYTAAFTVSTTRRYAHDTRVAAADWLESTRHPGEVVKCFGWSHYQGLVLHRSRRYHSYPEAHLFHMKHFATNELIEISSLQYLRHDRHGNKTFLRLYRHLRNNPEAFELVKTFDAPFLNRDLYGQLDPMFRCYFVAPTLEFYRPRHEPVAPAL